MSLQRRKPITIYILQCFSQDYDHVEREILLARYDRNEVEQHRWKLLESGIKHKQLSKEICSHNNALVKKWIADNYDAIKTPPEREEITVMDDFCVRNPPQKRTIYRDVAKERAMRAKLLSRYDIVPNGHYIDMPKVQYFPTFKVESMWESGPFYHAEELEIIDVVLQ